MSQTLPFKTKLSLSVEKVAKKVAKKKKNKKVEPLE
jgi:hypothetical protein